VLTVTYPKKTVYLAGTITGLTHDEARFGWRQDFKELMPEHIFCNSPMRGKEFLATHGILSSGHDYPDHAMATAAGITTRDYNDVVQSDAMVACFTESQGRPSLGTAVEYGMALSHQRPIVAIGPLDDPNIRHLMMERIAGYRVDTLEEGANIIVHLLTPGL
jgi:nucleoside 2-deoxyribosyltransferase